MPDGAKSLTIRAITIQALNFRQGFASQGAYSTDYSDSGNNASQTNLGENDDAYSLAVWYETKPLYLGAAFEFRSFANSPEEQTAVRVSSYYQVGATKLTALYQDASDVGGKLNKMIFTVAIGYRNSSK